MSAILIGVIYLSFISLGLPDSILGAAWPQMHLEIGAAQSAAGSVTLIVCGCTVISTLISDRLIDRFGTFWVSVVSVFLTAGALIGYSFASRLWILFIFAVPMGLGAGAIDAALNNVVALHLTARHMNWLHCCWGVGATIGPLLISSQLARTGGWHDGYRIISAIQFGLFAVLLSSKPLWKGLGFPARKEKGAGEKAQPFHPLRVRGVGSLLVSTFLYCSAELAAGLWAASYLVSVRGFSVQSAASAASIYYAGITAGRFVSGILSGKLSNERLIVLGQIVSALGVILFFPSAVPPQLALVLVGLGLAPIYPCIMHATPRWFGVEHSQRIIGLEMSSAYTGLTLMPALLGWVSGWASLAVYPPMLLCLIALMSVCTYLIRRAVNGAKR